jgi:hypothetical protein
MRSSSRFKTVPLGGYRSRRGDDLRREAATGGGSRAFFLESNIDGMADPAMGES